MKTVTTCDNMALAQGYEALLDENGIKCMLKEENNAMSQLATGGKLVTILVDDADYDKAVALISKEEEKIREELPWCPQCGCEDVEPFPDTRKHGASWVLVLLILFFFASLAMLLFFPLPIYIGLICIIASVSLICTWFRPSRRERFKCKKCNHIFYKY